MHFLFKFNKVNSRKSCTIWKWSRGQTQTSLYRIVFCCKINYDQLHNAFNIYINCGTLVLWLWFVCFEWKPLFLSIHLIDLWWIIYCLFSTITIKETLFSIGTISISFFLWCVSWNFFLWKICYLIGKKSRMTQHVFNGNFGVYNIYWFY